MRRYTDCSREVAMCSSRRCTSANYQFFEQVLAEIDGLDTVEDVVTHSVAAATSLLRTLSSRNDAEF